MFPRRLRNARGPCHLGEGSGGAFGPRREAGGLGELQAPQFYFFVKLILSRVVVSLGGALVIP